MKLAYCLLYSEQHCHRPVPIPGAMPEQSLKMRINSLLMIDDLTEDGNKFLGVPTLAFTYLLAYRKPLTLLWPAL